MKDRKRDYPDQLTFNNLMLTFVAVIPLFIFSQIPEFLRFQACIAAHQNHCEAQTGLGLVAAYLAVPLFIVLLKLRKKLSWKDVGFGKSKQPSKQIAKYLGLGVLLIAGINIVLAILSTRFKVLAEDQFSFGSGDITILKILPFALFAVVMAPLIEEIIFRGYLLSIVGRKYGFMAGSVVSSLIFGYIHGGVAPMIFAGALGLYLCFMFRKTQSMLPGLVLHMLNNLAAVVITIVTK